MLGGIVGSKWKKNALICLPALLAHQVHLEVAFRSDTAVSL